MSAFFKNNPNALRHCILFEVLHGNSIYHTYSNICSVIGKEAVDYKNFELSFNQFSKGLNNKKKEKPIAEILRNDIYALRVCILYEFLKYQNAKLSGSIFETFVNFCKVIGDDVMEYPEYEFWFYRFSNGDYDLNYERDKDKKIYELMDMPIVVMEKIVGKLDIFDRAKLVQTSRSLQTFVQNQKLFHHTLGLNVSLFTSYVKFGKSVHIEYRKNHVACKKIYKNRETLVRGVAYWKQAIRDIKPILKNSKLHLDTLEIKSEVDNKNLFDDLENVFKFTHQLNVKKLVLGKYQSDKFPNIIPSVKPGYLTTIEIVSRFPNVEMLKNVFEMEQWKQAKCFKMNGSFIWPLHHLYHFEEFTTGLEKLSVEDVREMKEILFESPDFNRCTLTFSDVIDVFIFEQEFGRSLRGNRFICHYTIPNSSEYFEIKVGLWNIQIRRMKA